MSLIKILSFVSAFFYLNSTVLAQSASSYNIKLYKQTDSLKNKYILDMDLTTQYPEGTNYMIRSFNDSKEKVKFTIHFGLVKKSNPTNQIGHFPVARISAELVDHPEVREIIAPAYQFDVAPAAFFYKAEANVNFNGENFYIKLYYDSFNVIGDNYIAPGSY